MNCVLNSLSTAISIYLNNKYSHTYVCIIQLKQMIQSVLNHKKWMLRRAEKIPPLFLTKCRNQRAIHLFKEVAKINKT